MRFTIVKERWYHKFLRKQMPKVNSQYQIHLSAHIGEKNNKWYLFDHISYECDLTDNTHPLIKNPMFSMCGEEPSGNIIDDECLNTCKAESKAESKEEVKTDPVAGSVDYLIKEIVTDIRTKTQESDTFDPFATITIYDTFETCIHTFLIETFQLTVQNIRNKVSLEDTLSQAKNLQNAHQVLLWEHLQNHITNCYSSQIDLPQT